jgi:hypothetical protein
VSKEAAYDEHVSPLMTKIIALCKEHKINMAAQFALDHDENDEPLMCTTVLHNVDPDDERGVERMQQLRRVMYPRSPLVALTIMGGRP